MSMSNEQKAPQGFWLGPDGYEKLAAVARQKGIADLDRYFQRRAHEAAVAVETETLTARQVIAAARRDAVAEYEAVCAEMDDVHAAAPRMAVA